MNEEQTAAPQGQVGPAAPPSRIALLLLDIGAPASPADVKPFLKRLYGDAHLLRSPFGTEMQKLFAAMVAWRRAPALSKTLEACGGSAPESGQLESLARALTEKLNAAGGSTFVPLVATSHGKPSLADAIAQARAQGCQRVVGLWARPFASQASASARGALALLALEEPALDVSVIERFDDAQEIRAVWAELVQKALDQLPGAERDGAHLIFSLQALPIADTVDPALASAQAFAEWIAQAIGGKNTWSVAYQHGVDPRASLLPAIEDELARLGSQHKHVVVAPLAHVCESLATRWELDQQLAKLAKTCAVASFSRCACPAQRPDLQAGLEAVIRRHLARMDEVRSQANNPWASPASAASAA